MAQLGFLGLGNHGLPDGPAFLEAGTKSRCGLNRPQRPASWRRKARAPPAPRPRKWPSAPTSFVYCVGDNAMARAITIGKDGLIEGMRPDSVTADCSTISPPKASRSARCSPRRARTFWMRPSPDRKPEPKAGRSRLWWAATRRLSSASKPYFEAMGKRMYLLRPRRAGLAGETRPEPGDGELDASIRRRNGPGDQEWHQAGTDVGDPGQHRRQERPDERQGSLHPEARLQHQIFHQMDA